MTGASSPVVSAPLAAPAVFVPCAAMVSNRLSQYKCTKLCRPARNDREVSYAGCQKLSQMATRPSKVAVAHLVKVLPLPRCLMRHGCALIRR